MIEKTCRKCGETKPLSEFCKNSKRKSGFGSPCKACRNAIQKAYIQTPSGKAKTKATRKRYLVSPLGRAVKAAEVRRYRTTPNGKAVTKASDRNKIEDKPLAYKAHNLARTAINNGTLERMPCEVCGEENVAAHHDDYTKPLEVRWLCRLHHAEAHKSKTETAEVL